MNLPSQAPGRFLLLTAAWKSLYHPGTEEVAACLPRSARSDLRILAPEKDVPESISHGWFPS